MQRVLVLALLALLAVVAFDLHVARRTRRAAGERPHVQIHSTGLGLPPALALRSASMTSIVSGDVFLRDAASPDGLRVATFWNDGGLLEFESFAIPRDPGAVERFADHCAGQVRGTFLAAAVHGSLYVSDARAEHVGSILAELGATARPWEAPVASWAFVARRAEDGWVPVGEAYSAQRGVSLVAPLSLRADVERILDDAEVRAISLVARWAVDAQRLGASAVRGVELKNGALDALVVPPPAAGDGSSATLRWPELELAGAARFSAQVALGPLATRPVVLEVRVDGELAGSRPVEPSPERVQWEPWELDLAPLEGVVSLELALSDDSVQTGTVLWGAPVVSDR